MAVKKDITIPPPIGTACTVRHSGEQTTINRRIPPGPVVDCWRIGIAGLDALLDWDGGPPSSLWIAGYSQEPLA